MNWHLFKGGVRTEILEKLHNPRVLEETFMKLENERDNVISEAIKAYEMIKEVPKPDDEETLRKKRVSVSI
jgi:hypothetical protein